MTKAWKRVNAYVVVSVAQFGSGIIFEDPAGKGSVKE